MLHPDEENIEKRDYPHPQFCQNKTVSLSTSKTYIVTGQVKRAIGLLIKKKSWREAIKSILGKVIGKILVK